MGIRDWFKKKEDEPQNKKIEGAWKFNQGSTHLTISDFTDTGVSYGDLVDGTTPMKLYTFKMYKQDLNAFGEAGILGRQFEEVAFEAPALWDIESCINNGMLATLLNQTNAINNTYNKGKQIEVLGRFDSNSNFTYSDPGIQDYIDETYVPMLNKQIEQQRIADEQKSRKENQPGLFIKALGKVLDFFDGIKERRAERNEMKLLAAAEERLANQPPPLSREEQGLSSDEIRLFGRSAFRIGNTNDGNVLAIDIVGEPQMLDDGSYLYTANKQLVGSFHKASVLNSVPNCQFSLPIPPEQLNDFLMGCENPENPYAKSNAEALMYLLNQKPLEGRGLYMGGLFVGNDRNLYFSEYQHIQESIDRLNGNDKTQQPQRTTDEYEKY